MSQKSLKKLVRKINTLDLELLDLDKLSKKKSKPISKKWSCRHMFDH